MLHESKGRDQRRREARAIPWAELIPQHRAAVRRLIELLDSAVSALPAPRPPEESALPAASARVHPARRSQLAFINGGRGTGKSSVELSLRRALRSHEGFAEMTAGLDSPEVTAAQSLRPQLEWLVPLDMEPLPAGVNVLAAIVVRIEQALRGHARAGEPCGWLGRAELGEADTLTQLDTLRTQVVQAWDGGQAARSPRQTLHAWSQEVLDAERARLDVVERLAFVLDRLAWQRHQRSGHNSLFILVVDDFDLSPAHCVELLRVVRMITTPRLFFIFAGDLEMAQEVMYFNALGDTATLLRGGPTPRACEARQEHLARTVASSNLRKLVPPSHRVALGPLGAEEVPRLYLTPATHEGPALRFVEKLRRWTFTLDGETHPMADALLGPWAGHAPEAIDVDRFRMFRAVLEVPIRVLVDLDLALTELIEEHGSPSAAALAEVIAEDLMLRLDEVVDTDLPQDDREAIRAAIHERGIPSYFDVHSTTVLEGRALGTRPFITPLVFDQRLSWTRDASPSAPLRSLGAGVLLLHDLAVKTGAPSSAAPVNRSFGVLGRSTYLGLDGHHAIRNWPELVWDCVGEAILSAQLWSATLPSEDVSADELLRGWLRAWYAVESGQHRLAFAPFDPALVDAQFVGAPASDRGDNDGAGWRRRVRVIAMLRPELGWTDDAVGPLLALPGLADFAGRNEVARAVRALRLEALKTTTHAALIAPQVPGEVGAEIIARLKALVSAGARSRPDAPPVIASHLLDENWQETLAAGAGWQKFPYRLLADLVRSVKQLFSSAPALSPAQSPLDAFVERSAGYVIELLDFLGAQEAFEGRSAFNRFAAEPGQPGPLCPSLQELRDAGVIPSTDISMTPPPSLG